MHGQLWTCYVLYLMCILQLNDIKTDDKKIFDTFISSVNESTFFGDINDEIYLKMKKYKQKIFNLKSLLRLSRIYSEKSIMDYARSHLEDYSKYLAFKIEEEEIIHFLMKIVHLQHIDFNGKLMLTEKFVDLFGWSLSFIDHIIQFIYIKNCFQFLLFIRDFHETYRAYIKFEDYYNIFKNDQLYAKYKKYMGKYFNIDLTYFENECEKQNLETLEQRHIHYSSLNDDTWT